MRNPKMTKPKPMLRPWPEKCDATSYGHLVELGRPEGSPFCGGGYKGLSVRGLTDELGLTDMLGIGMHHILNEKVEQYRKNRV